MTKQNRQAVFAGVLGNTLEWYDFALYGHFSVIIGQTFFPKEDPQIAIVAAFAVFSVSFFMRPLGALFFSYLGDRFGRKRALALSMIGMAIPTAGIGVLPSYADWGVLSTIGLLVLRLLQGLSVGGEMGGAVTYVMEHTPRHRVGFASSLLQSSTCLGLLAGTIVSALLSYGLGPEDFQRYGWRIPFVLGLLAAWLGFRIRRRMPESELYESAKREARLVKNPVARAIKTQPKEILLGVVILIPMTATFFLAFVYFNSFMMTSLKLVAGESLMITSSGLVLSILCTLLGGWLSDRIGPRRLLMVGVLALFLGIGPILETFARSHSISLIIGAFLLLSILIGIYTSAVFGTVAGLFGTEIRFSGVSLTVNLASPVFGSTAPLLSAWLVESLGLPLGLEVLSVYFMLLCLLAMVAIRRIQHAHYPDWK